MPFIPENDPAQEGSNVLLEDVDGAGTMGLPATDGRQLKKVCISWVEDFDFTTTSPHDFAPLEAGDYVTDWELEVTTAFDDPAAWLTLGTVSATGSILAINQNDPGTVGTYASQENFKASGSDAVRLVISPGTSTQGAGRVVVTIRRA